MVNVNDLAIVELETITAFDIISGYFKWVLDELQDATIANTEDKADITGKQGRKLTSIKRNKAVTIRGTNGLISAGMLETQVGNAFENKVTPVMWPDYLTVTGNKAVTSYVAVGTAGNEIGELRVRNTSGTLGATTLTQGADTNTGVFTYDPETKTITFAEGELPDGTEIVVYYHRHIQASVLENLSDNYSEKVALYIDGLAEDKCGVRYHIQFYVPKADFNGNFDITLGGDQAVHAFEAESLAGACGGSGALWTYTVFDENSSDAA